MKQLKDGGLGFYPGGVLFLGYYLLAAFLVGCIIFTPRDFLFFVLGIAVPLSLLVFLCIFLQRTFPVCVLYKDFLQAEGRNYYLVGIKAYYLHKRVFGSGKNSQRRQTLVVEFTDASPLVLENWYLLSKTDQKKLMQEFSQRGAVQLPEKEPEPMPVYYDNNDIGRYR